MQIGNADSDVAGRPKSPQTQAANGGYAEIMSRRALLLLSLIVLIGIALRITTLRHESVDYDELFSRTVALLPMHSALEVVRSDLVHPPLYYLILKAGVNIWGAGVFGIRLWSLLFGIATLPLVTAIGTRLPGARYAGFLAAAVLAVNTSHIFYSQEARSYAFYTFLAMLLVFWLTVVTRDGQRNRLWLAECLLMALLVYAHYVAALYVLSVVIAVLVCKLPRQTKIFTLLASGFAAVSFVPWLVNVVGVYQAKHGVGENLDWQGHPVFYNLKEVWASSIGVMDFKGATTLALVLVAVLSFAALKLTSQRQSLRDSPVVVGLALYVAMPPLVLFLLSIKPFNLTLFGPRHLEPSIAALGLLCCYGLETLANRLGRFSTYAFATGSVVLLVTGIVPTFTGMVHGPSRFPYDRIAKDVRSEALTGEQIYVTWPGIEEPVNFYCQAQCVQILPTDYSALPDAIILLYRPNALREMQRCQELLKQGFSFGPNVYYTNGQQSLWGTEMVYLKRNRRLSSRNY